MRQTFILLIMTLTASALLATGTPKDVKVNESQLTWKGKKVLGSHEGTIAVQSGTLDFDGDMLVGGTFTIDMTTINCSDLKPGQGKEKLEGHLASDDFFGAATFPTATFVITKVSSRGKAGEYRIVGNMTIKGKTNEVKFNAIVKDGMAKADITLDRTEYDVRYGSGSFFDSLGDNTIYDEFDLSVALAY